VSKQRFDFQTTRRRGMAKSRCKVNVITALTHLVSGAPSVAGGSMNGGTGWTQVLIGPA